MRRIDLSKIDISGWKHPRNSISSDCLEKTNRFATEYYDGNIIELWRDTYPQYLLLGSNLEGEEIAAHMRADENIISSYGWGQYVWHDLLRGWWHFVAYIIDKLAEISYKVTCQDTGIAVVYNKQDEAEFAHNVLKEYGYKSIIEEVIL